MSRLFLVRHGETIWHAENRYAGSSDVPLTSRGAEQAQILAEWAASTDLSHIYVSPLRRARDTAAAVERATGLTAKVEQRLREVSFGIAEGLTATDLQDQYPDVLATFLADPAQNFFPGGEDPAVAARRVRAAVEEIATSSGPNGRVLLVGHNTLFRLLLCDLLDVPFARYRTLFPALRNGAATEIELGSGKFGLHALNVSLQTAL